MRPNNRVKILEAAFRVAERLGVTGVTFDSVAEEAGLTRGGLLYHFPSREALIEGIHQHLAEEWEKRLLELVGKPLEAASPRERFSAYARACAQSATRAELLFMLDAATNPELVAPWVEVPDRWAPSTPSGKPDRHSIAQFVARLAADGLWVYESISCRPLPPAIRKEVVKELVRVFENGVSG